MSRALSLAIAIALVVSALPAPAQLTPEVPLSTPQYGTPPGDQFGPVVGTSGSEFLVAWTDYRGNPGAIYATRVSRDGRVLDSTGIRLDLDLDWNGQLLGAFYIDGAYTILYSYEAVLQPPVSRVAAARIDDRGEILEPLHDVYEGDRIVAAATNGTTIVLMSGIHFVALNDRNEFIASSEIPTGPAYGGGIASNGTNFLAMTFTYNGRTNSVNFVALDSAGSPTVSKYLQTSATGTPAVIASDGRDYLVLYSDAAAGSFIMHHLDATGTSLNSTKSPGYTAFVWTGQSYLATALTGDFTKPQLTAVSLDRDGTPIGSSHILGDGATSIVTTTGAAWDGTEALLTWTSGRQDSPSGFDVFGSVASADGTLLSPVKSIPQSSNAQRTVAAASSGSQDLVVWTEPGGVYATRVSAQGVALDGRGIAVTTEDEWAIAATWDGTTYIVGWAGTNGLEVQRIDKNGALVGSPVAIAKCSGLFDLAADSESAVVFYRICNEFPIVAQRLPFTGSIGSPVPVTAGGDNPRAAWNGSEWLIVWNYLIPIPGLLVSPPPTRGEVYAARLTSSFAVVQPEIPIAVSDNDSDGPPLVATDGHDFFLTWAHVSYNGNNGVQIRNMHADGAMDDTTLAVSGSVAPWSVVWDGRHYTIAYGTFTPYSNRDLFLTHVGTHDQLTISATATDEANAALVAWPGRPIRVVYTRVAAEPVYGGVPRLFLRDEINKARRRPLRPR